MPIKIPAKLFVERDKLTVKFICEAKDLEQYDSGKELENPQSLVLAWLWLKVNIETSETNRVK